MRLRAFSNTLETEAATGDCHSIYYVIRDRNLDNLRIDLGHTTRGPVLAVQALHKVITRVIRLDSHQ